MYKRQIEGGVLLVIGSGVVGFLTDKHADIRNSAMKAKEVLRIGDKIPVILSEVKERSDGKLFIKLKNDPVNDPWEEIGDIHPNGSRETGEVVKFLSSYGTLVKFSSGFAGFLHSSEISWLAKSVKGSERFSVGEQIEVVILESDKEKRRLDVSLRLATKNPWDILLEKHPIGSKSLGEITEVMDYGAFVKLEIGLQGLLHKSKLPNEDVTFEKGQKIEVEVLSFDSSRKRIGLGLASV